MLWRAQRRKDLLLGVSEKKGFVGGRAGFYGMVSKATDAGAKSAKNQYQMIQKNATVLAAEEE